MSTRIRWCDLDSGSWISRDPGGFAMGDANLYRFVANGPTNFVDPSGKDITVEEGNDVAWYQFLNNMLHQQVCVDTPDGKVCFSFGVTGYDFWLGTIGTVYTRGPVKGARVVSRKKTTPQEDAEFLKHMKLLVGDKYVYNLAGNTCRDFSQDEFQKAPGTEVPP